MALHSNEVVNQAPLPAHDPRAPMTPTQTAIVGKRKAFVERGKVMARKARLMAAHRPISPASGSVVSLYRWFDAPVLEQIPEAPLSNEKIVEQCFERVIQETGFSRPEILSRRTFACLVRARWRLFWMLHKKTSLSIADIGRVVNRDHTTVLYGLKQYRRLTARGAA